MVHFSSTGWAKNADAHRIHLLKKGSVRGSAKLKTAYLETATLLKLSAGGKSGELYLMAGPTQAFHENNKIK